MNDNPHGWSASTVDAWQGWSQNILPLRVEGLPAGTRRATTDAEELLSTAVGWWDASRYRDGDRFLRNQGVAGEILDARLGSSFTANSNDPLFLPAQDDGYVYIPNGVSNNSMSLPTGLTYLNTTNEIEVIQRIALPTWPPVNTTTLTQHTDFGSGKRFNTNVLINNRLRAQVFPDGITGYNLDSTNAMPTNSSETTYWLRFTFKANDGSGNRVHEWFYAEDSSTVPTSWTSLGGATTAGALTWTVAINPNMYFGVGNSTNDIKWMRAIYRTSIGGSNVIDADFTNLSANATSFTESSSNAATITIARNSSGRKTVVMPSRWNGGRSCFLFGTDDYMEVQNAWQYPALDFEPNQNFTIVGVFRLWGAAATSWTLLSRGPNRNAVNGDGWQVRAQAGVGFTSNIRAGDNVTDGLALSITFTSGQLFLTGVTMNRAGFTNTSYYNSTIANNTTPVAFHPYATKTSQAMRIGSDINNQRPADCEFYGAAIFRRALSATEIAIITRYYGAA